MLDIPGIGFIANQVIGKEVKNAISKSIGDGLDKIDRGDEIGATADFSQAAAVIIVTALTVVYMASGRGAGKAAIAGLRPVFQGLSSQKSMVAKLLEWVGTRTPHGSWLNQNLLPTQVAKIANWGTSTAIGFNAGWWVNETIEASKTYRLGSHVYDLVHPEKNGNFDMGFALSNHLHPARPPHFGFNTLRIVRLAK